MYTTLSRMKTLDGLYILNGFDKKHLKCDIRSLNEMTRLRRQNQFRLETPCAVSLPDSIHEIHTSKYKFTAFSFQMPPKRPMDFTVTYHCTYRNVAYKPGS